MASTALKVFSTPSASSSALQRLDRVDPPALHVDQRHLQLGPQPGQRRAQVVGDGVAGVAEPGHRGLQPLQHLVQPRRQFVQFVARSPRTGARAFRSPSRTAATTAFSRPIDALTLRLTSTPAAQAEQQHHAHAPPQRADDLSAT